MRRRHILSVCLVLLLFFPFVALAQSEITYQYWIDDNKDEATTATATDADGSGADISLNIDVGSLSPGVHYYNIRSVEISAASGFVNWGTTYRYIFSIPAVGEDVDPSLISKYVYWIDDDYEHRVETEVGVENDEQFTTTSISDVASIDVSSLSPGVHYYNMRILDVNGNWSTTQRYLFSIPAEGSGESPANLKNIEYWIDDDITNAVSKPISDDEYTTDGAFASIDLSTLRAGVHYYNVRIQDEDGKWSAPQRYIFSIPAEGSGETPKDLKNIEYWIDDDIANAVRKPIADNEYTTEGFFAQIDMEDYAPGVHYYNVRTQDEDGIWGAPQRYLFSIPAPQQAAVDKQITGYLYAFNDDAQRSVTFASPVDEFDQSLSFNAPSPEPLVVVDDSCKFEFNEADGTAKLRRNVHMSFALIFKDQSNALSAPLVEDFVVKDSLTEEVTTITSPGTYQVATHAEGGFSAMRFVVESSTKLALRTSGDCGLRLYDSEGELLNAYDSLEIKAGASRTFDAGTYYAIVFENAEAIKLALYPGDETGLNALRPSISYDEQTQIVTISGTVDGASYYYTINGDNPTIESTLYTEPFLVSQNVTVKAIAAWGDMVVSDPPRSYVVSTIKGDADASGTIDIADAVAIVQFILGTPAENFAENLADMNSDNVVDIFDAMLLVNYVLTHTSSPNGSRMRGTADEPAESLMLAAEEDGISIGIDQPERFTAFQFDLTLPSGTELNDVKLLSESSAHRLMFAQLGGNTYRVIGFSMSNAKFPETDGKFLELRLANAASGTVSVDNVLFVTPTNKKMAFAGGQLGTTAIEDIEVNYEEKEIFDLQGQKRGNSRNNLDRGVYIINHKKVIIK